MFKSIEELRIQRKLVQKHLDWLDEQIENLTKARVSNEINLDDTHQEIAKNSHLHREKTEEEAIDKTNLVENALNELPNLEKEAAHYSNTSNIKNAKFGCLAFFVFITLLFLFLLFGLPYLLD